METNSGENPVKDTERNRRHYKDPDDKSLCMTATMYKGAGNNGMTLVPEKLFDESLDKMTNKDGKAHCVTATYQSAEPKNSMERKQRTMIPVDMNEDLPENINRIYDNDSKSHKPKRIHLIPKEELNDFVRQRSVYSEEGKSPCLLARSDSPKIMKKETHDKPKQVGTAVDIKGHDQIKRVYSPNGKSPTVTACGGGHREPKVVSGAWRARSVDENGKRVDWKETTPQQMLELRKDEKTNSVTSVQKDNVLTKDNVYWRKLTPLECERLQTVPDNYTNHVSNTQRYKMLGNGWTIEVIAHIFENMKLLEDGKDLPKPKGQDTFDF